MTKETVGLTFLAGSCLIIIVSAQNFTEPLKFEYYTANLNDWCDKRWNDKVPCEKNGATFKFTTYPKTNCTVTLAIPDCTDGSSIETHGLFFNIRSMRLQNNDTLKLYESNEDLETGALLLSFTSATVRCKENPHSCGQFLGIFAAVKYYKIIFESSGGPTNEKGDAISIDTTNVYRSNVPKEAKNADDKFLCPALEGQVRRQAICEPGDRVNCPFEYKLPPSPSDTTGVHNLTQGYTWNQWQHHCATPTWALTTTLAPGPTSIAPIDSGFNFGRGKYFANYSTVFLDQYCGKELNLPCEHNAPLRAGTLRFQYAKLPRPGFLDPNSGRGKECSVMVKVNTSACNGSTAEYGIYLHFKSVKLTPSRKDPKEGDSFYVEDHVSPVARLPKWNVVRMSENPDACSTKAPTSCGVYVSPKFSQDPEPYVKLIYTPDADDGVPGFADRVLVDYIVLTKEAGEENLESMCDGLKGFMPNQLMCETRDRVNCPAEDARALKETYRVDKLNQGVRWQSYNEKCTALGWPKASIFTTPASKPAVGGNRPAESVNEGEASSTVSPSTGSDGGLSGGAIAGIVIGGILLAAVAGGGGWWYWNRYRKKKLPLAQTEGAGKPSGPSKPSGT